MAWDDREIIAQFLCRDEAAIKNAADKYERYCSSIAYRILGNGEDVRECLNDTWLKLWESIPPTVPACRKTLWGQCGSVVGGIKGVCIVGA